MQYWAEIGYPFRPQAFTKYLNQKKSNQMFLKPENIRDYACSTYRKCGVHTKGLSPSFASNIKSI